MKKKRNSQQPNAARILAMVLLGFLPTLATAGPREQADCKKILENYEKLRTGHRYLPALFTAPALLKPDEREPESALLEGLSIDNVAGATGDFNCRRDGTLDSIELHLLPPDSSDARYKLSATRFAAVSTGLMGAIWSGDLRQSERAFDDLLRQATNRSKEALIRGDKYPEGSGLLELGKEMTATLHLSAKGPSLIIDRSMAKNIGLGDQQVH